MAARVDFTNQIARVVVNSSVSGASYYLGAQWFTSIPAPAAAVFGMTAAIVNLIAEPLFNQIFAQPGATDASKALGGAVTVLTDGVFGALAANFATGYTITAGAAVSLFLSALVASIVVVFILNLCGCGNILND